MNIEMQFMWAIQSLAAPFELQKRLFPDYVEIPDELLLEHDEAHQEFIESGESIPLTDLQKEKIEFLDNYIQEMSNKNDASLWTMDALENGKEWSLIRYFAIELLQAMGWCDRLPPSSEERGNYFCKTRTPNSDITEDGKKV